MVNLKNQPGLAPSRKIWAVAIAGGLANTTTAVVAFYFPDADVVQLEASLGGWLEMLVMLVAGYFTRSRA